MAEKDPKFPPGPPGPHPHGHHPCGPWPSVFPPRREDGVWPAPPRPWRNDTEPVIGVRPWEDCCEGEDPCMCITSAEVEKWDAGFDVLSANSAIWDSNAYDNSWKDSADLWQGAYDTVEENSAFWNSAWGLTSGWDSGAVERLAELVGESSAFLQTYYGLDHIVTDNTLSGYGNADYPLGVSEWVKTIMNGMKDALDDLYSGPWGTSGARNWLHKDAYTDVEEQLRQINRLLWELKPGVFDKEHNWYPDGVFPQLYKIWKLLKEGGGGGGGLPEITPEDEGKVLTVVNQEAVWGEGGDASWKESAANWQGAYEAVSANSAAWDKGDDTWKNSAANWEEAYDAVNNSAKYWNSGSKITWVGVHDLDASNADQYNAPDTIYYNV